MASALDHQTDGRTAMLPLRPKVAASDAADAPKSILKGSSRNEAIPANIPTPKTDAEKRRLDTAMEYALLIQEQKDAQAQILNAIEELSEYPANPVPTAEETQRFTTLVTPFQPSDYDALVEERHANNLCGYTLCPNPPRSRDLRHPWKHPKGWENWCSAACTRQALYVKAQLNEVPAWERRSEGSSSVTLRPSPESTSLPQSASSNTADQRHREQETLALERGESVSSNKIHRVVTRSMVEHQTRSTSPPLREPPSRAPASVRFEDLIHRSPRTNNQDTDLQDFSD